MNLLVDECLPKALVDELTLRGHNVRWARKDFAGYSDTQLLAVAAAEQRLIVTEDRDFGTLTMFHRLPAPGIISVYLSKFPGDLTDTVKSVVLTIDRLGNSLHGALTIIEPGRVRQRALPQSQTMH